jgi:elongation factor G-like protein
MTTTTSFPLRQLVTDPSERFQLRFAQQAGVLLEGFAGISTESTAKGLLVKAVAERDLHAATAMLRVAFPVVRVDPIEVVYSSDGMLEPYVRVRVTTPADYYGDVVGQLNKRRGLIEDMVDAAKGYKLVTVTAPFAEMLGYDDVLAKTTRNRAMAEYQFLDYRPAPKDPPTPPGPAAAMA